MNNKKYIDIIKGKLEKMGYVSSDLDARVKAIVDYANRNNLNAIEILENGFKTEDLTPEIVQLLNSVRPPTSYVTRRLKQVPTSKFVKRSIIE